MGLVRRGHSESWGPQQKRLQKLLWSEISASVSGGESRLLLDKKFLLLKETGQSSSSLNIYSTYIGRYIKT